MKCCLVFPISGIISNEKQLTFCYRNPLTFLGLLIHGLQAIEAVLFTYYWVIFKAGVNKMVFAVLLCQTAIFSINIHRLAQRWPVINERWCRLEIKFASVWNSGLEPKPNYRPLFIKFMLFGVFISACDFILHIARKYTQAKFELEFCNLTESILHRIYWRERAHMLRFTGHQTWMVPIVELERWVVINCWNLSLVFIILLSTWLNIRFRELKERIQQLFVTNVGGNWIDVFNHYQLLADLVADVDKEMGFIILQISSHLILILSYYTYKLTR